MTSSWLTQSDHLVWYRFKNHGYIIEAFEWELIYNLINGKEWNLNTVSCLMLWVS
jgi:hypothetical protein